MNKVAGIVSAAVAATTFGAAAAHAAVYVFPVPFAPGKTYATGMLEAPAGTSSNAFTFTLAPMVSGLNTAFQGTFFEGQPNTNDGIVLADLTIYSGLPNPDGSVNGTDTLIATTGNFNPATTVDTVNAGLASGTPYFLEAVTTVPAGDVGDFSVTGAVGNLSGAPEPSIWAMLIVGVGLVGAALRTKPRAAALTA